MNKWKKVKMNGPTPNKKLPTRIMLQKEGIT